MNNIAYGEWFNSQNEDDRRLFGRIYVETRCLYSKGPEDEDDLKDFGEKNNVTEFIDIDRSKDGASQLKYIQENMKYVHDRRCWEDQGEGKKSTVESMLEDMKVSQGKAKKEKDKNAITQYVELLESFL